MAPWIICNCCICLPEERLSFGELPPFNIGDCRAEHEPVGLVIDDRIAVPFVSTVVIVRSKFLQVRLKRDVLDPPVEINQLRSVLIRQFACAHKPVLQILITRCRLTVNIMLIIGRWHRRPVEITAMQRLSDIAVKSFSAVHKEPMLSTMRGNTHCDSKCLTACFQLTEDVAARPFFKGVPAGDLTFVHLKAVMMLCYGNNIFSAGGLNHPCPFVRVKPFSFEHGYEVFIAEIGVPAVCLDMMFKFGAALNVHIAGIPFICKSRNTENAPVNENAEFCSPVPFGYGIGRERAPLICVGPLGDDRIYFIEIWL